MNFLSKLIICTICIMFFAVVILTYKTFNLEKDFMNLIGKTEKIKNDLDTKIDSSLQLISMSQTKNEEVTVNLEKHFGIDVSHWNGNIVTEIPEKDHISFIICKATQGTSFIDKDFNENWAAIKELEKIRGAYHFYMYGDDPIKQANHFCKVVKNLQKDDFSLILDIEELSLPKTNVDKKRLKEDLLSFLAHIENKTNRIPILYTDYSFANEYLDDTKFSRYPLWLAEYTKSATPKVPETWKEKGIMIHQKSDNYNINSTKVDFDVFTGKKEDLYK